MNLIDKIMSGFKQNDIKQQNRYYRKESEEFRYIFDLSEQQSQEHAYKGMYFSIENIINDIDGIELKNKLYECKVWYHYGRPTLGDEGTKSKYYGYEKVLIEFDFEKLKNDEKYTEYIFRNLLIPKRILELHDIAFGEKEGYSSGNYVGSVIENNGNLDIYMDPIIANLVDNSTNMIYLKQQYKVRKQELQKQEIEKEQNLQERKEESVQKRIEELKEELKILTNEDHEIETQGKRL